MKTPEEGRASVDAAIVNHILPMLYVCIDDLLDVVDHKSVPKELLVRCRKLLPGYLPHSFEYPKDNK